MSNVLFRTLFWGRGLVPAPCLVSALSHDLRPHMDTKIPAHSCGTSVWVQCPWEFIDVISHTYYSSSELHLVFWSLGLSFQKLYIKKKLSRHPVVWSGKSSVELLEYWSGKSCLSWILRPPEFFWTRASQTVLLAHLWCCHPFWGESQEVSH